MRFYFRWSRIKDISISKKLYFIVGAMAVLIAFELLTLWFAIHTLSSVRALVGAEGLWSKAQKDAIYQLEKYYRTEDENDYRSFQKFMTVPAGDHKTRLELMKANPDFNIVREGFLEGRNHPEDIDGMVKLLRRFHSISYIEEAIFAWTAGDSVITQLITISENLHREINSSSPSEEKLTSLIAELEPINQQLTALEDQFSFTLGEGSRWLEHLILTLLFIVALTVEITGLVLTIAISRGISKGLNEINRVAAKITKGDLTERATVFAKDEIGQVAASINEMTEQLVNSNMELGQFAYVASHDLQEPLRKIQSFVSRIKEKEEGQLSEPAKDYFVRIQNAAHRMQLLIDNLLSYSRVNNSEINHQKVDLNQLLIKVKEELHDIIEEKNAVILSDNLPVVEVTEFQFQQLFLNLLGNSLKYHKEGESPVISIQYSVVKEAYQSQHNGNGDYHKISFSDEGIGFDQKYSEKIFELFQRLHGRTEYSGTGIGLSICRKIVSNHNGTISATGYAGKGTCIDIFLPVS